jgi:hypothetical protein
MLNLESTGGIMADKVVDAVVRDLEKAVREIKNSEKEVEKNKTVK